MRARREDIPLSFEDGESYRRTVDWGEMEAAWERWQAGRDATEAFKGLPGDSCPVPHWGYVIMGRMRMKYHDHDEVYSAGDVFYMPPGHIPVTEEDTELLVFSPKGEVPKVFQAAARNREAMKRNAS